MAILNFGSVNIDHVYRVDHFVRPGETLSSESYQRFAGGKGFNQSIALAYAGAKVSHAGKIGEDGAWLRKGLAEAGADVSFLQVCDHPTGHAIIQVDAQGENAIVLEGGANQSITPADAESTLAHFGPGDCLLLQNEISAMADIIRIGADRGMKIAFNPAPLTSAIAHYPLDLIDIFILNEIEAEELTGQAEPEAALCEMRKSYPAATTILTLGARGVIAATTTEQVSVPAEPVTPVDTTAAGDTFIGYFLADYLDGASLGNALQAATKAAAICVTQNGASASIPKR
jgi:ribokinase